MITMNTIKFGIIGSNTIVDTVLEAAKLEPRFLVTAIYSRSQQTADAFAAKHNIAYTFTSLEQMAKSPLIDAVYIASPNFLHAQQSILFMQHGKHVLCEKPIASNAKEAKTMFEASAKYKVSLMEAMKPSLTPNFAKVIENIKNIGTVRRYFACYCQYSSRYNKLKEGTVLNAFKPQYANGAAIDIGVYTIYPMVVLFGRPQKIEASGLLLSTGVDGQGAVNFTYNQMNATVMYSKIADSNLSTEIQGEDGTISLNRINTIDTVTLKPRMGDEQAINIANQLNEYYYELAEFINLIEKRQLESTINSHQNSLITIEIVDEIRKQLGVKYPADEAVY